MKISDIKILKLENPDKVKAYASFVIDDSFVVNELRIIEGNNGLFVAMPSRNTTKGFKDICHPINSELRKRINELIINEYLK